LPPPPLPLLAVVVVPVAPSLGPATVDDAAPEVPGEPEVG
jgi:hypothetical protein